LNIPLPPHTSEEGFLYTLSEAVLPILDEFKPQLIVNSAGQDNHYSDPITNMNFSAHGYAELTRLLKADIAVLEGGYSIEGALPYVNTGIVLAMAGLDYSRLTEPDYEPENLRQSDETNRWIEETCKNVLNVWRHREALTEQIRSKPDCNRRSRSIYYDTDNIQELQDETVTICDHCAGALRIDSKAGGGSHILAVHIPVNACAGCRDQGYQWYASASTEQFDQVHLQNRVDDDYQLKG
jgi:hypothetical protein